jgi:CheY-like chemotaxis protein
VQGSPLTVAEAVGANLPYLRRFARACTGSQKSGDAYVAALVEAIVADPDLLDRDTAACIDIYRIFLKLLNSLPINGRSPRQPRLDEAKRNLDMLAPRARQAFLLVAMEGFKPQDAAQILDVRPGEFEDLIDEAGQEIARQIATDVVIIEDEPIIALELEHLVKELGHRVVGVARTERQALAVVGQTGPGLIMADVQLADGSSGLSAVNTILQGVSVPVVFITAYPERLLTGTRPEPTFLIAKPFRSDGVKAVVSQALFFDVRGRPLRANLAAT